ncbi:hypothetical protein [Pseudomonas aeruginosa]|uniref:hypothetical protein n=1 Tax=Pseudomonas aeruginosa TaxID=287 RepID=UPI0006281EB2|nr:hypothetical protein [Pseudomonas aeruginosa]ARN49409.1 hypothetical protein A6752_27980 [Pseudomonas aeruginosa]KKJ40474.1 hypothetical protein T649_27895 [Pseudomonas aeruginosa MRSN 321]KSP05552.1 hypothetical protein APB11_11730 [Pseudomonas aeruginosa]MBG4310238.1 hypothetical protein [Pseudomonas aeruginosa]MBG5270398.1 hypothetical protein [Pseudomonas aeruginosa]
MMTFLMGLDAVLCVLVVLAALDFLRTVHLFEHPILSLSFYLVAVGAFGLLNELAKGYWVSPWAVVMHIGVVGYAWSCRKQIFRQDRRWDGAERRRH